MTKRTYEKLESTIGVRFGDRKLLKNAFIHRSYLNENRSYDQPSNEKLEFLGDSVLSLITSLYLYKHYPTFHEGEYTNIKAAIVRTESLSEAASTLELGQYLLLSKGEADHGGATNMSILADCFEALIGAIFLDQGFDRANEFVLAHLFKGTLDKIVKNKLYDSAKNMLQEHLQEKYKKLPEYRIVKEKGPEHDKTYTVEVVFDERKLGQGTASSKKHAEEQAAQAALKQLGI